MGRNKGESAVTVINIMMGTWLIRKGPWGRSQSCVQGMAMKQKWPSGKRGIDGCESKPSHLVA